MEEVRDIIKKFSPEQIKQYLDRIGMPPVKEATREVLDELIYRHQCTIAFENLDSYDFHKEVCLDGDYLFQKIIQGTRGGYCLELNGLFYRLVVSLGYDARPCFTRVLLGKNDLRWPIDHRGTLVKLDGAEYFCDVGLGGPMPSGALNIETEEWQTFGDESFRVVPCMRGWLAIHRKTRIKQEVEPGKAPQTERIEVVISDIACFDTDFNFLNYYKSTKKESLFCAHRVFNLRIDGGYRSIRDDIYKEVTTKGLVTEKISEQLEEIEPLIKEKFNIEI